MSFFIRLNELCWNPCTLALFMSVGIYFTARSGFFQLTKIPLIFKNTFGKMFRKSCGDGISPLGALSSSLAACMGTGNIIGVATAITAGGPGAVVWMIVSATIGEMTCCAENILGIMHRVKDKNNQWLGGAMLYIENAFGSRKIASVYAVLCIGASLGMGNMTQANAIEQAVGDKISVIPPLLGVIIAVIAAMVIIGGVNRIASVTEKLIPLASAVFIVSCVAVIFVNRENIIPAVKLIISGAFSPKSIGGGIGGYTFGKVIKTGISRGVFSNEAGLGSSAIVHSAANTEQPLNQGLWGIAEVFIDTVLMCSLTALALIASGAYTLVDNPTKMNTLAFSSVWGNYADDFIGISLCVFAFATIIGWSYYGETAAIYAFGQKAVMPYRIIYLLCIVIGCTAQLETVWAISDIFNLLMSIPNLFALIRLRKQVIAEIQRGTKSLSS